MYHCLPSGDCLGFTCCQPFQAVFIPCQIGNDSLAIGSIGFCTSYYLQQGSSSSSFWRDAKQCEHAFVINTFYWCARSLDVTSSCLISFWSLAMTKGSSVAVSLLRTSIKNHGQILKCIALRDMLLKHYPATMTPKLISCEDFYVQLAKE